MAQATPFSKILIANRGEIALRVMRCASRLGYATVAVYSEADAAAAHVLTADQAVCIGGPLPSESYLRIPALIEAARMAGADAVHPGYGFLAENDAFAQACREAGLVFIGPSPEAMRAMGDKAGAKALMMEAGVPCIPGYQGEDQSLQRLAEEADRLGYPVMIKATAGGGGRGMRLVRRAEEFPGLLSSAQSEALHAFGSATVLLERAILEPRHVEIQVFADRHGHAVHLGERDCSVQRRHQKLIEEAPSPAVSSELRERMGATAVKAIQAVGYEGAGTLEFLLDQDGHFYFMEMNTRLQVEHPVTEAITGLDLVEWQLRVAAGEPLPLDQASIRFEGHSIEVRLCAEDASTGFIPQSGTIRRWQAPEDLRAEHALNDGSEIAPYYDSMIAKLISHGRTRDEARRKLLRGLQETVALGVRTNQEFLVRCLAHPAFASGTTTTAFIDQYEADLLRIDSSASDRAGLIGAWLLRETARQDQHAPESRRLAHDLPLRMSFTLDDAAKKISIVQKSPMHFTLTHASGESIDQDEHQLTLVAQEPHAARFILDGLMENVSFERDLNHLWLHYAGRQYILEDQTHQPTVRHQDTSTDGRIRASMNGRVVAVLAAPGDSVKAGQPLLVLEAMKMEHVHTAPISGLLQSLHATLGEQVQARHILAEVVIEA
ncbi:acetyl/propionyl/methylcrotonyl-CoA carboxylase subunit alpha [Ottowia caeni]|uniref:acetyl/propionyl/methylcrotonyl-CoA carboxylase subunit alpha n=1 Tax=Ottowia caeni TaxID=2870339 RepID=UPI001E32DC40|nr:acetyl-CoA carboxylase biotin carboxylase subunit [Ottowia caeni]